MSRWAPAHTHTPATTATATIYRVTRLCRHPPIFHPVPFSSSARNLPPFLSPYANRPCLEGQLSPPSCTAQPLACNPSSVFPSHSLMGIASSTLTSAGRDNCNGLFSWLSLLMSPLSSYFSSEPLDMSGPSATPPRGVIIIASTYWVTARCQAYVFPRASGNSSSELLL